MKEKTCVKWYELFGQKVENVLAIIVLVSPAHYGHRIHLMACTFRKHSNIKLISWKRKDSAAAVWRLPAEYRKPKDMEILIPRQRADLLCKSQRSDDRGHGTFLLLGMEHF